MKKQFCTVEGIEGSGKSTMVNYIQEYLESMGLDVIATREPGGIEIAEQIRSIILDPKNTSMDEMTEALLYAAARRQHLVEKIIPALESGKVVICDRFIDSSLAYQGYARGIGMEKILLINEFAVDQWMPNLTLYFDLEPEVGLARIQANKNREVNRLDLEDLDFHHAVRRGYLSLLEQFPERIVLLQANRPIEDLFEEVRDILNKRFL